MTVTATYMKPIFHSCSSSKRAGAYEKIRGVILAGRESIRAMSQSKITEIKEVIMTIHKIKIFLAIAVLSVSLAASPITTVAQRGSSPKPDSRILYHDGPVMLGTSAVYIIWYGNFSGSTTTAILADLASSLGSSPYFNINTTYPNFAGNAPNGGVVYVGGVNDAHSRGPSLTDQDLEQIVTTHIESGPFPLDTTGIYLVITSEDVTNIRPDGTTYCTPGTPPHHGLAPIMGTYVKYGHIGSATRCPTSLGSHFFGPDGQLPSPNGNFEADVAALTMARVMSAMLTNPFGTGWYDRYGLQNSDKCVGRFGTTYTSQNGARANVRLGGRDFLMQELWVNDRRGRCSLSYP